jgi:type IV secretion system protein VirB10
MTAHHPQPADGDRGAIPPRSGASGTHRTQMALGAALVGGGLLAGFYMLTSSPKRIADKPVKAATVQSVVSHQPAPPAPAAPPPPVHIAPAVTQARPPAPPVDAALEAAYRAPVLAFSLTPQSMPATVGPGVETPRASPEDGGLDRRLTPSRFDVAKAGHIGDRRFIVAQGTSIPCILETAMQSDQPGFVSCVIPRDVLSDNGQVVLMEKGTQVVGEYRGGLNQGQTRLHVLWGRAKTPTGVVVTLASAATDGLGRAGVGGTIDNHWWERFGSALLLSVVGDASGAGTAALKKSAGVEAQQAGQAGSQAAAIAVEQSSAIKPTLHKNQGEMVSIFVARDLDFSGIYQLQVVIPSGWAPSQGRPLK